MPDIIVKQQPNTSLTVQSNSTQLLIRQAAANNITVATTGNSYVLPTATNSTLGGIIVGSNLTIANGVLSATSAGGGVTAFNNRTGNVSLTANDLSGLAFPLNGNVTSGNVTIAGQVDGIANLNANGTLNQRSAYGISRTLTSGNAQYQFATVVQDTNLNGFVYMARAFDTTIARGLSQSELRITPSALTFASSNKESNGTLVSCSTMGVSSGGVSFTYQSSGGFVSFSVGSTGTAFFGQMRYSTSANEVATEVMNRSACDNRYVRISSRN